jgi:thioredoxin 1
MSGNSKEKASTSTVTAISTPQDFYDAIDKTEKKYVFVDFYATWCGPCRKFAPTLNTLSLGYNKHVDFLKIDIDSEAGKVGDSFNVKSLPTFLIFKKGNKNAPFCEPIVGTSVDFKGILELLNK